MMVDTMTGITGTDVVDTLGLIYIGCSLGSNLSLGKYLGRLVGLLVVCQFDSRAGLFANQDQSKQLFEEVIFENFLYFSALVDKSETVNLQEYRIFDNICIIYLFCLITLL